MTDELGCTATTIFEIAPGIPILSEVTPQLQNANCFRTTGSITIDNSGSNNFQYSLDGINFQNSPVFDNLPPGAYNVYIQDINNCVINFGVFVELEEGIDGLIYISDLSWTRKIKFVGVYSKIFFTKNYKMHGYLTCRL